jgi:hypothetical protein
LGVCGSSTPNFKRSHHHARTSTSMVETTSPKGKGKAAGAPDPADAALGDRESEIYDRQIRLWGVQAQKRMSSSRVLYAGFTGANAEAAKNLVLAGIHATVQVRHSQITTKAMLMCGL